MQIVRKTAITYYIYPQNARQMSDVKTVEYKGSFPNYRGCPQDDLPEFAFIGRSNVGKSSLINMLVRQKEMARTSQKPGKTQLINYFLVNQSWYIVDLPGYGYARISKTKRKEWEKMIQDYLLHRPNLCLAFVLIDGKLPSQQVDVEFINWLGEMSVPFVLVYTKIEKLKPQELEANLQSIRTGLLEHWNALPQEFLSSAVSLQGRNEILQFIEGVLGKLDDTH
jgi:GTP-binding protein